uniref:Uncharacterized protein n=2 Tax=Schistocephalus solidus TaxID=70667 RepID=A0A0X3PNT2_SCHSO
MVVVGRHRSRNETRSPRCALGLTVKPSQQSLNRTIVTDKTKSLCLNGWGVGILTGRRFKPQVAANKPNNLHTSKVQSEIAATVSTVFVSILNLLRNEYCSRPLEVIFIKYDPTWIEK